MLKLPIHQRSVLKFGFVEESFFRFQQSPVQESEPDDRRASSPAIVPATWACPVDRWSKQPLDVGALGRVSFTSSGPLDVER